MKKVIYGMPAKDEVRLDRYIYAGCVIELPMKEWDCLCYLDAEPEIDFKIIVGDITQLDVDVVVNAANPQLQRGGGVCGAIFKVAGPGLAEEILDKYPHGIEVGEAAITGGYASRAKWIVHAVAPRAGSDGFGDHVKLSNAYRNAILLADSVGAKSIAIPSLGTGIYGWDVAKAAPYVIHDGISPSMGQLRNVKSIVLCCYTASDAETYTSTYHRIYQPKPINQCQ
jgi:O-acetyl-ADP-ribose deacetylase (regulator of RNase III)